MPAVLLLIVAWVYVVLLMAAAEATGAGGSALGAIGILLFYGALPLAITVYLLRAVVRRRARRSAKRVNVLQDLEGEAGRRDPAGSALDPRGGGHAAGDAVAAEREEP